MISELPNSEEARKNSFENSGMSEERLDRIKPIMQKYVDDDKLGGVISMVYRKGELVHEEYYGYRNLDRRLPMTEDTIFRIYSMSKPITTVAALMLYEQGHFLLSDPVQQYIPELKGLMVYDANAKDGSKRRKPKRPITIHDLMTHTSGFSYGVFSATAVDSLYWDVNPLQANDLDDFIERMAKLPLINEPGESWYYSVSTDMLGALIERVSGEKFGDFLKTNIFDLLEMSNTRFDVRNDELDRFAVNYEWDKSGGLVVADSGSTSQFIAPRTMHSGGGGLVSTAHDYLKFTRMLLNDGELDGVRLLGRKTVELMRSNHLKQGEYAPGWGFGLGVRVNMNPAKTKLPTTRGMYGWAGMANTFFFIDPEEEMIGMVWTQLLPFGHFPIRDQFVTATYQAIID